MMSSGGGYDERDAWASEERESAMAAKRNNDAVEFEAYASKRPKASPCQVNNLVIDVLGDDDVRAVDGQIEREWRCLEQSPGMIRLLLRGAKQLEEESRSNAEALRAAEREIARLREDNERLRVEVDGLKEKGVNAEKTLTAEEVQGQRWKDLFVSSDVFREHIEPKLGEPWRAVLMEACGKARSNTIEDRKPMKLRRQDLAESGCSADLLRWSIPRGLKPKAALMSLLLENNDLDALLVAIQAGGPWKGLVKDGRLSCALAAERGHLGLLKHLHENGYSWNEETCLMAAKGGHVDVLKYAHENGCPWNGRTCDAAAKMGHVNALRYAHENGCPWQTKNKSTCEIAAERGHLDVLKYAREKGCPWDEETCKAASKGGHLDVLKYLHEKKCPWSEESCEWAADGGHFDVLKYLHENGCPWGVETCVAAAEFGHLDVLKYAHKNGCPWDKETCTFAAMGGHLDALKYAHENGCPWDEMTCMEAAWGGHLDVIKYLHEKGCPWDEDTCKYAALGGHLDVLEYAHENWCPWDEATCSNAASGGHLIVLKYAREKGCPWNRMDCRHGAYRNGYMEVVEWIDKFTTN